MVPRRHLTPAFGAGLRGDQGGTTGDTEIGLGSRLVTSAASYRDER